MLITLCCEINYNSLSLLKQTNTNTMNIFAMINEGNLTSELDCNLAILNNFPNTKAYYKAYNKVKEFIIQNHFHDEFQFDEIDIKIEISQILDLYKANF